MSERKKIEIRSDEVNEILTRPPGWILRCGSIVLLGITALFIIGSALFKYPDTLTAPIVVTSENLPAQLVAKTTGSVEELFRKDGDIVSKGDIIALIENTANFEDYRKLNVIIDSLYGGTLSCDSIDTGIFPTSLQLGDIQNSYNQFLSALKECKNFIKLDYHKKKISLVKRTLEAERSMIRKYSGKLSLSLEQVSIATIRCDRDSALLSQKVISQLDYESSKTSKLTARQDYEAVRNSLDELKLSSLQSEQSILDLELDREKQLNALENSFSADYDLLRAAIRKWEQDYLLISPLDGKVYFTKFWQKNQNVSAGDIVFTVVPVREANISGKIYLPLAGAGKVKVGQKVNIKFDNYPYMEFGMLEVAVAGVSSVPAIIDEERVYVVDVKLPAKLRTNYGKELQFSEEMRGTAEIITVNLSLLQRVVFPVKHILKSRI